MKSWCLPPGRLHCLINANAFLHLLKQKRLTPCPFRQQLAFATIEYYGSDGFNNASLISFGVVMKGTNDELNSNIVLGEVKCDVHTHTYKKYC